MLEWTPELLRELNCALTFLNLDHEILIIGYRITLDGIKYWILNDSLGEEWGENGYVNKQRGVKSVQEISGMIMNIWYPIINKVMWKHKQ